MEQPVTLDSLMTDFVCDMAVADDELSDSIFTCVDNFIDDLCVQVMQDENSPFETDPSEGDLPFNYIIDKVLERRAVLNFAREEVRANPSFDSSLLSMLDDIPDDNKEISQLKEDIKNAAEHRDPLNN